MSARILSRIALVVAVVLAQRLAFGAEPPTAAAAGAAAPLVAEAPPEVPTDTNAVIVTVNGKSLTMGKINWIKPNADSASVQQIADFWLTTQLLYAEAEKRGVTDSPKMQFLSGFSAQQANGHELVRLVREETKVSEAEVEKAFSEKPETDSRTREQIEQGLLGMAQSEAADKFIKDLKTNATNTVQKSEFLIKLEASAAAQPLRR